MKKNNYWVLFWVLLLSACQEQPVVIPPLQPPVLGERKILVEEFTGVRCVNCPAGAAEIDNLKSLYAENLVAVSIHAGFFANPFPNHTDFRTADGDQLASYICSPDPEPEGYPSASVNRVLFSGQEKRYVSRQSWAGFIQQQSQIVPKISINIENAFDATTRLLTTKITLLPTTTLTGEHRVSALLTEDDIFDKQLTPAGEIDNYRHKHVFRKALTDAIGAPLSSPLAAGTPVVKTLTYVLPTGWNVAKCHTIAFVHRNEGNEKDVLQVAEKKIQ